MSARSNRCEKKERLCHNILNDLIDNRSTELAPNYGLITASMGAMEDPWEIFWSLSKFIAIFLKTIAL